MRQLSYESERRRDKVMSEEQFEQIVDAILNGKYSWACLLILRFAGYNPLHYIPYRTYNRLVKDHARRDLPRDERSAGEKIVKIDNLDHIKTLDRAKSEITGGASERWSFYLARRF